MKRAFQTVVALLLVTPVAGFAVPIVDVDNDNTGSDGATFVTADQHLSQVFEVGLDGILTMIDVQVFRRGLGAGDLVFDLLPVIGGVPDANLASSLATVTINASDVSLTQDDFLGVDLSAFGITVSTGDLLAVALRGTATLSLGDSFLWSRERPRDYEQGYFRNNTTESWRVVFDSDFGIRTVVDTPEIPEPGTLLLFGIGLAALGLGRRRRA